MAGVKGRREGATVYAPTGVALGAVAYVGQGTDGLQILWLEYPVGAALGDYIAATGDDGVPVWELAADLITDSAFVPTYIAPTETFTVPANKQALFAEAIDNEGALDVVGSLIMVD